MAKQKKPVLFPPRIFNVYKPVGMSSFSVVNHFKRCLPEGYGKIGHFGTLDPFADGILLIGIAGACRLNNQIHSGLLKTYSAKGIFGIKTLSADKETLDSEIEIDNEVQEKLASLCIKSLEQELFEKFSKDYMQIPPSYSAAKHEGKALYKWARQGTFIEKEAVKRSVVDFKITSLDGVSMDFLVTVSTGTYIRTLFEDIAKVLGTFGYLESLTRCNIGKINIEDSLRVDQWPSIALNNDGHTLGSSMDLSEVLPYSKIQLNIDDSSRYLLGNPVSSHRKNTTEVFVYNPQNEIIGVGKIEEKKLYPKINFNYSLNTTSSS